MTLALPFFTRPAFLAAEDRAAVQSWALGATVAAAPSTSGTANQVAAGRRSLTATLDPDVRQRLLAAFRPLLPAILTSFGIAPFEPRFETELVIYEDGAFFHRHIDTGPQVRRLVSAVYYLHREPRGFTGGELRIHPLGPGAPRDIVPEQNLLVAFPSFTPHEVLPVNVPSGERAAARYAINIWVHRA